MALTPSLTLILLVIGILALGVYLFAWPLWRRRLALRQAFPHHWQGILEELVPLYRRLPPPLQRQLERHVQLFLHEKPIYGCDGLEVTDAIRVAIAGHACLLIVARPFSDFDAIRSVLVYPGAYRVTEAVSDGMLEAVEQEVRAGESWEEGRVVLSWDDCLAASRDPDGPHNVVLHEFAHQLDHAGGVTNGAPQLDSDSARRWQAVMSEAYERLTRDYDEEGSGWLDPYGMSHPVEFFAVLTEAFFQQPRTLRQHEPDIYEVLTRFYRISPAEGFRPVD